jgi:ankyrin repeat protein
MSAKPTRRFVLGLSGASLSLLLLRRGALALTPLFSESYTVVNAAALNKTDDVRTLLQQVKDPNITDSLGRTPLSYAASLGNTEMIKVLLDSGARIDYRDLSGATALHWAAETGHADVIRLLLAAKAPVDVTNRQGVTPLMMAADANKSDAARALLEGGADRKRQDFSGRDALGWAAGKPMIVSILQATKSP